MRFNEDGTLLVPHGYVGCLACDPIEKKPFFHVLPGSDALTFGMLGCDFHCGYCQNWVTSQMLRDPDAVAPPKLTTPRQLVDYAIQHGAPVVASSYNEPLITSEWAVDVFKEGKARGLLTAWIRRNRSPTTKRRSSRMRSSTDSKCPLNVSALCAGETINAP